MCLRIILVVGLVIESSLTDQVQIRNNRADTDEGLKEAGDSLLAALADLGCSFKMIGATASCVSEVSKDWKDADNRERALCCGKFEVNYCLLDRVKDKCNADSYSRFKDAIIKSNDNIKETDKCSGYGYRWYDWKSWKCRIPWLLIGLVLLAILLIVIICFSFSKKR